MTYRSNALGDFGAGDARPLIIGITGPIASGKSTVAEMLRRRGAAIIDADRVYRSLLAPGTALWKKIVERFDPTIVQADDEIDRAALGSIVFRDPTALAELERITHPAVVAEIRRQIMVSRAPVIVIEAVKLNQAGLLADTGSLWFVTADPEVRLRRLISRRGLDEAQARARIAASLDVLESEVPVDVTIDNSGDVATTAKAVDEAWHKVTEALPHGMREAAFAAESPEEGA